MQRKITGMLKKSYPLLDYIEIPNKKWYYSKKEDKLHKFDEGLFRAHPKLDTNETNMYNKASSLKVLPTDAKVVRVEQVNNAIKCLNPDSTEDPTWTQITNKEEMEDWLLRRNKKHHQQVWEDESIPTQPQIYDLLTKEQKIEQLLRGKIDIEMLEITDHAKE